MYEQYELNFSKNQLYMFSFGIDIDVTNTDSYLVHHKLKNQKR